MRSLRPLLFATALSTLAACGSEASSTATIDDASTPPDVAVTPDMPAADVPPPPVDRPAPADAPLPADPCPPFCARVVGTMGCVRDMATCVRNCGAQIAATPPRCRDELDAYFACGIGSRASCTSGVMNFDGCDAQQGDLIGCAAKPDDGGVDPCARKIECGECVSVAGCGWCGRCLPGDATGPAQPAACSGRPWVRAAAMCM